MRKQLSLLGVAMITATLCAVISCSKETDTVLKPTMASEAVVDDPQVDPLNSLIAEYLRFDQEQSMTELQEVASWIEESIELEDSTAEAHLPVILGAKAVAFYTYDAQLDGWRQYLLVANHENYLSVLQGDLLALEGMEYEVDLQKGKKKPKKPKYPKPIREKFGKRRGCTVKKCSPGGLCLDKSFIPCGGERSECSTNNDCHGQSEGVGSDDILGGIIDKGY